MAKDQDKQELIGYGLKKGRIWKTAFDQRENVAPERTHWTNLSLKWVRDLSESWVEDCFSDFNGNCRELGVLVLICEAVTSESFGGLFLQLNTYEDPDYWYLTPWEREV